MDRVAHLEKRLSIGWERCNAAPPGTERQALEDFWIGLLQQYERLCMDMGVPSTRWPNGSQKPLRSSCQ